jgi:hypothetical protein
VQARGAFECAQQDLHSKLAVRAAQTTASGDDGTDDGKAGMKRALTPHHERSAELQALCCQSSAQTDLYRSLQRDGEKRAPRR